MITIAITAQQIFEITMALADEIEDSGTINPTNTASYLVRTPGILSIIQAELIGYDSTPTLIASMDAELQLSATQCLTVVPYMLGAELFKEENQDIYDHFMIKIRELKNLRNTPAAEVAITDVYGIIPIEEE